MLAITTFGKVLSPLLLKIEAADVLETLFNETDYIKSAIHKHGELFSHHLTPTILVVYPSLPHIGGDGQDAGDGEGPTAAENVGVLCDFWNACDVLAKKHNLKKTIRSGNTFGMIKVC